jgi:hypothetical protein
VDVQPAPRLGEIFAQADVADGRWAVGLVTARTDLDCSPAADLAPPAAASAAAFASELQGKRVVEITHEDHDSVLRWVLALEARGRAGPALLGDFSGDDVILEYQFIDSPETADQLGFHGSPTILIDGGSLYLRR